MFEYDKKLLDPAIPIWWPCINGITTIKYDLTDDRIKCIKTQLYRGAEFISILNIFLSGQYSNCDFVKDPAMGDYYFAQKINELAREYICPSGDTEINYTYDDASIICKPVIEIDVKNLVL